MRKRNALFLLTGVTVLAIALVLTVPTVQAATVTNRDLFNFRVEIEGVTVAGFREVSGLESETEVIEFREGDITRKIPGRTKYSNIVLKRGITGVDDLWTWRKQITDGGLERKSGSIIVLDVLGQEVTRYNFFEAWPAKWTGPTLDTKGDTHTVEEIELAVEKIEKA